MRTMSQPTKEDLLHIKSLYHALDEKAAFQSLKDRNSAPLTKEAAQLIDDVFFLLKRSPNQNRTVSKLRLALADIATDLISTEQENDSAEDR